MSIGREQDNDLPLDDPELSRHHAVIEAAANGWQVRDLGSSNGTRVNDQRISAPVLLQVGEVIELGDTQLTLEVCFGELQMNQKQAKQITETIEAFLKNKTNALAILLSVVHETSRRSSILGVRGGHTPAAHTQNRKFFQLS